MLPGRWMIRRSRLPTRLIIAATPGLPFSLVAGRNHPNAAVVRSSSTAGWHDPTVSLLPSARSRAHQILFAGASVLLAAACTTSSPSAPPAPVTETHPPSGPVPAGLERFYGQSLTWADCAPYATSEDARSAFQARDIQCARLTVPMDYTKPDGPTITLGLLRHKATDPSSRIGSLVINPGGPGASGMVAATGLIKPTASTALGKRFDLVGFDPRGIGASEPPVHCLSDAERDADRADDSETDGSPQGVIRQEAQEKDFGIKCVQRTEHCPEMLANLGTREVVKDMA